MADKVGTNCRYCGKSVASGGTFTLGQILFTNEEGEMTHNPGIVGIFHQECWPKWKAENPLPEPIQGDDS